MKNKLMQILKEGSRIAAATVRRDIQRGKKTDLDERLANYMILRGTAVIPKPGTKYWYIDQDEQGNLYEVLPARFVAIGRNCVVLSDFEVDELIKQTVDAELTPSIFVLPVNNVFASEEAAQAEFERRTGGE